MARHLSSATIATARSKTKPKKTFIAASRAPMTVLNAVVSFVLMSDASPETAEALQDVGEFLLLISSVAVVVGLIGESRSEKWRPSPPRVKFWHGAFVWMVTVGVAGELIADGAVFSGSHRLETLSISELKAATDHVAALQTEVIALRKKQPRTIDRSFSIFRASEKRRANERRNSVCGGLYRLRISLVLALRSTQKS